MTRHRVLLRLMLIVCSCFFINSCIDEQFIEDYFTLREDDAQVFEKIAHMSQEANKLYPDFDFARTSPAYIILTNGDGSEPHGYLLNPTTPLPPGSELISPYMVGNLTVYRNDDLLDEAENALGPNFFILQGLSVNDQPMLTVRTLRQNEYNFYYEFKDGNDDNSVPLVFIHEAFHLFQFNSWTIPQTEPLNWVQYPLDTEILTLNLALFDIMLDAHQTNDPIEAQVILGRYVTLMNALFEADPTPENYIFNVSLDRQWTEGSARYIEHFSALNSIYPDINNDPSHGYRSHISNVIFPQALPPLFGVRMWYHVGAGAIHLLALNDVDVMKAMSQGTGQLQLAEELLQLTEQQQQDILTGLQNGDDWPSYVDEANHLMSL